MQLSDCCTLTRNRRDSASELNPGKLKSIAAHALEARESLSVKSVEPHMIRQIYTELFLQHFGKRPNINFKDPRVDLVLTRVFSMCLREDIDFPTYVTANMHGMKKWVAQNRRIGFRPNMLSGENAKKRYEIYVRRSNRAKRGEVEGFDQRTEMGAFRTELIEAESLAGRLFIDRHLVGKFTTWVEISDEVENVSDLWRGLDARHDHRLTKREYMASACKLASFVGDDRVDSEFTRARIIAISAVLRSYRYNLPDVIGTPRAVDAWDFAAQIVSRFHDPHKPQQIHIDGVPGELRWGGLAHVG